MMKIKTRTRQLCNEKWVSEVKMGYFGRWRSVQNLDPGSQSRLPGDNYYHHCYIDSAKEAEKAITQYLAQLGIGISQYPHPKQ